jgi:alginate O-acetyltransferase complex protein AlgI
MLLGGLWHGANWTFVIWGGLHGIYLVGERYLKQVAARWKLLGGPGFKLALALVTFALINVTWVLFRAKTLPAALGMLGSMAGLQPHAAAMLPTVKIVETVVCLVGLLSAQWYMRERTLENVVTQSPRLLVAATWVCMTFAVVITQGTGDAFIYFQF